MTQLNLKGCLEVALEAAKAADKAIMEIYSTDFDVQHKDDKSPVTLADKTAHDIICEYLKPLGYPVISEEGIEQASADCLSNDARALRTDEVQGKPERRSGVYTQVHEHAERGFNAADRCSQRSGDVFWLVDPLDGTKEFISKNGEFTVNIALVQNERPVLGVVSAPALGVVYYAISGQGAFKVEEGKVSRIHCSNVSELKEATIAVSRSHLKPEDKAFIERAGITKVKPLGSALKYCYLAEGKVDLSVRYTPLMQWDLAASDVIVHEAGGCALDFARQQYGYVMAEARQALAKGLLVGANISSEGDIGCA